MKASDSSIGGDNGGVRDAVNVFILAVLVLAQPVFTLLSSNPVFFVVRRSDSLEVLLLILTLVVVVPGLLAMVCFLLHRVHWLAGRVASVILVGVCAGLFFAPLLKGAVILSGWQQLNLVIFLGALVAAAYALLPVLRTLVTYMSPAVLAVPLLFWFNSGLQQALAVSDPVATAQQVSRPHNVVMVVFDSFPVTSLLTQARAIDAARFPNFAQLAGASTWYRNASTVNELTWWAVPALLSGREVYGETALPVHNEFPRNLFTALGSTYDFHVTEYLSKLCPPDLCGEADVTFSERLRQFRGLLQDIAVLYQHTLYPTDFAELLPRIGETLGGFVHGPVTANDDAPIHKYAQGAVTEKFIHSLAPADKPQLFFLHALLPHAPWHYTPSGKEYGAGYFDKIHGLHGPEKKWREDQWAINVAYQRHLMQAAYADLQLGRLIARLKQQGMYDDTLLVVVSDHGSSYRAGHYHRRATQTSVADFLGVPLFIKYPGQADGHIDDRNVSIVDVLPTLFDQLGVESDWPMDGFSLRSPGALNRTGKRLRNQQQEVFEVAADYYLSSDTIAKKFSLLATGEGVYDPFAISLIPALNGRALDTFTLRASNDTFTVHNSRQFEEVDLTSNYAPVFVSGFAKGIPLDTPLAIALNGQIVTVTKIFSDAPTRHRFAAMLPESGLRQWRNTVSIHRVETQGGRYILYQSTLVRMGG